MWHCGVVAITTTQFYSTKSELRFHADSNPAHGVLKICNDEDLWKWWPQLEIRLNAFRQSTIPQKQFVIIIVIQSPKMYVREVYRWHCFNVLFVVNRPLLMCQKYKYVPVCKYNMHKMLALKIEIYCCK